MPVSEHEFRHALSHFASGVTVVTTVDKDGNPFGITVSAFCSVSLSPPLILICIEKATMSHYAFAESGRFAVNILDEKQAAISEHFATAYPDKFSGIETSAGPGGVPVLANALAVLQCRVRSSVDAGDHSVFIAEVDSVNVDSGQPLIYFRSGYHALANQ